MEYHSAEKKKSAIDIRNLNEFLTLLEVKKASLKRLHTSYDPIFTTCSRRQNYSNGDKNS